MPSPEPQANTAAPAPVAAAAEPKAAEGDQPAPPMPAPVDDLAGGPEHKAVPAKPQEPNLFDLYADAGDDEVAPSREAPADAPAAEPPVQATDADAIGEPEMAESEGSADADATEPDADPLEPAESAADVSEDPAEASESEPKTENTDEEEAAEDAAEPAEAEPAEADSAAAAFAAPNEPMRRWTNDTGSDQAQGWLVEVRADRVRILKVNGRHTTVAREALSAADRDYVSAVGERLAAERQGTTAAPTATAGL